MMRASKHTLANGVRIITVPMADNPALTVMVLAAVGSNHEKSSEQGLAHFLEHMAMKGGRKYPTALAVSSTLDALGAESNAFTGPEFTGYYAKGHPKHWSTMLAVIADLYLTPRLEAGELDKERGVIIEEINMYDDLPMAKVADLLDELMYGDQPAGWSTLGTKDIIRSIDQSTMNKFHQRHYTAANTLVIMAGDLPKPGLKPKLSQIFGGLKSSRPVPKHWPQTAQTKPAVKFHSKNTDQVHLRLGLRAYPAGDKRQPALQVLNAVLGSGMSSRLFQKLREDMGVCYYVRSRVEAHSTYGALVISVGVDTGRTTEVIQVIMAELNRLRTDLVEPAELKKAKDYLTGHTFLNLETSIGVVEFYLEQEILTDQLKTPNQWTKSLQAVTAEDIKRVAKDIIKNQQLNLAAIGNIKDQAAVRRALILPA